MQTIARIHRGLVWVLLAGLLVQIYFAGVFLFGAGPTSFHENWGYMFWLLTPLMVVLALVGGLGRRLIGLSVLLVILTTVQVNLPHLRASIPWAAALHPVNALAMVGVTVLMARGKWTGTKAHGHPSHEQRVIRTG